VEEAVVVVQIEEHRVNMAVQVVVAAEFHFLILHLHQIHHIT
jgi:hypothetical protein